MPQVDITKAITPPAYAKRLGVKADTVRAWIDSGALVGLDCSTKPGGKPRWRLSESAIAAFEASRQSRPKPKATRRRRKQQPGVIQFF